MIPVRIYVEGGGDTWPTRTACRQGFSDFFGKILPPGCRPRIIAAGGRNEAYQSFCTALKQGGAFVMLLVDSEDPVPAKMAVWVHLKTRDGWDQPKPASADHAHMMVTCMEAWFLADTQALAAYYGQGFLTNSLPKNPDVEKIPRGDIVAALEHATRNTRTKGQYHKTRHAFQILGSLDPDKVARASSHASHLYAVLRAKCQS